MIIINDSNDSVTVYTYDDTDTMYWAHNRKFTIPAAHVYRHEKAPGAAAFPDRKLAIRVNDDPRFEIQQPKSGAYSPNAVVRIDSSQGVTHPSSVILEPSPQRPPNSPQGSEIREDEGLVAGNSTKVFSPSRNHYMTLDSTDGLQFWQAAPTPKRLHADLVPAVYGILLGGVFFECDQNLRVLTTTSSYAGDARMRVTDKGYLIEKFSGQLLWSLWGDPNQFF